MTMKNGPMLGIAVMSFGIFLFMANDALGKFLIGNYSLGQVLLLRSLAALFILLPIVARIGFRSLFAVDKPVQLAFRSTLATAEVAAFYAAVSVLPLAATLSFWLAAPIFVAALAPLLLGERVGARRWTAILIGFVGVVIVLQPSSASFSGGATIAIFGSFAFALMMITTRSLRGTGDAVLVFWQMMGALIAGIVLSFVSWSPIDVTGYALLSVLGVTAMVAHLCIARAFKLADAATIAPLQYTMLPWATLFGFVFFDEVPAATTLIGGVVIIGSGLFIFFRERQLSKRSSTISEAPLPPGA
ncbi:DMT family transporter [Fulvimarina endophytica]|uniref:DMT family transporter n=1 Tax=Fulvimarina endophytica TaxID=2293836 RepID=A0A371X1Q2_9HYPH|nr:DMT family transporter [Fulvimarina endophytica]RFC63153.1 DMT family transporter [Fulvimarina endophytica]